MDEVTSGSGSVWSPAKRKKYRRKQKTLRSKSKKLKRLKPEELLPLEKENENQETPMRSSLPKLRLVKYKVQLPNPKMHTSLSEAIHLLEQLDDNSLKIKFLWPSVMDSTRLLEEQITNLNQRLHANQVELMEMKRKRWCYMCEEEATYMQKINSEQYFYCSEACESELRRRLESTH